MKLMENGSETSMVMFKKVDKHRLNEEVKRVNNVLRHIQTTSITETNNLIKAVSAYIANKLGIKEAT